MDVASLIRFHEGLKSIPYRCPSGKLTIGYGRNLEDVGISLPEAEYLLGNDIRRCVDRCGMLVPGFDYLGPVRQAVLIDMCFNIGIAGLLKFRRLMQALSDQNYRIAAIEILNSKYAVQVGQRAIRLSTMMEKNEWPDDIEVR